MTVSVVVIPAIGADAAMFHFYYACFGAMSSSLGSHLWVPWLHPFFYPLLRVTWLWMKNHALSIAFL